MTRCADVETLMGRRIDGTDGLYGRPVMGATDRSSSNLSPSQNLMQSPCCLTNLAYHWH